MKIGFVCSSGGSAAMAACRMAMQANLIDAENVSVVVDRECGAIELFREHGIDVRFIPFDRQDSFSEKVTEHFRAHSVNLVFLFYSRLISESLYGVLPTINIHPSLLPAFLGFKSLEQAKANGARFLGATAHLADADADSGSILVQASSPLPVWADMAWMNRISYIQKALVTAVCIDLAIAGALHLDASQQKCAWSDHSPAALSVNPTFCSQTMLDSFLLFQKENDCIAIDVTPL